MPLFKIRCSCIGEIMGQKGLGETGKTHCKNWVKEQLYNRRKDFSSKYTDKGITTEYESIVFASQQLGWGNVLKNVDHFEDEYMTGTPDVLTYDSVKDLKNSWDAFTFPLFATEPDKDYSFQLQGYMRLTGKMKAQLVYTLMDTPENIIESEARRISYKAGYTELDAALFDEVQKKMTYTDIPASLRIKAFDLTYDQSVVDKVIERVKECREYIAQLLNDAGIVLPDDTHGTN